MERVTAQEAGQHVGSEINLAGWCIASGPSEE
jgi:hypothetical protein